jgi:hypothetical protein
MRFLKIQKINVKNAYAKMKILIAIHFVMKQYKNAKATAPMIHTIIDG